MSREPEAARDDPSGNEPVRLTRFFEVPPRRLFEAWSDADQYRRWAWGSLGAQTEATVDCRVGGRYRVSTKRPDGAEWSFSGEFVECVPDKRLVYTVTWQPPMEYESRRETVAIVLTPRDRGTELEFVHTGVPGAKAREAHRRGWDNTLETLSQLLDA